SEKVTRRKGETASRHTRNNGYSPTPQEHGRRKGRHDQKPRQKKAPTIRSGLSCHHSVKHQYRLMSA
ncbi:hypothetical protein, partial [Pseudomonas sp. AD21]|uniref:hypothetical protein n=1 Tax=Pseudomonas sp. AD21 TaxID=396378 RepID=UPI001C4432A0